MIDCTIEYRRAEKTRGGWQYAPMDNPIRKDTASINSVHDLAPLVRATVKEIGHSCTVYMKLPKKVRKPNGWDKACGALAFVEYPL